MKNGIHRYYLSVYSFSGSPDVTFSAEIGQNDLYKFCLLEKFSDPQEISSLFLYTATHKYVEHISCLSFDLV